MYIPDIIGQALPYLISAITGVGGWFFGRKKQKNDFLDELQSSIDLLSGKNSELLTEVLNLRQENIELKANQTEMLLEVSKLREKLEMSRAEQEAMSEILKSLNIPKPAIKRRPKKQ